MKKFIPLISRIFLCGIFLRTGIGKIIDPSLTLQMMESKNLPVPNLLLIPTIIVLLAGGISVLLGYKARYGALLLIGFLIPTTLIFHTDFADRMQEIQFFKNLGLMGGLLMVVAYGSGPFSLDERIHTPQVSSD